MSTTIKTHERPEGANGDLYDKMINSKGATAIKDAMTSLCLEFDGTHGMVGAVTHDGTDCVHFSIKTFNHEEVKCEYALPMDEWDEICKDLQGEELITQAAIMLANAMAKSGINLNK